MTVGEPPVINKALLKIKILERIPKPNLALLSSASVHHEFSMPTAVDMTSNHASTRRTWFSRLVTTIPEMIGIGEFILLHSRQSFGTI